MIDNDQTGMFRNSAGCSGIRGGPLIIGRVGAPRLLMPMPYRGPPLMMGGSGVGFAAGLLIGIEHNRNGMGGANQIGGFSHGASNHGSEGGYSRGMRNFLKTNKKYREKQKKKKDKKKKSRK